MKIGVLGTGVVAKAIGKGFVALGYEVMMGSRTAHNEEAIAWAKEVGSRGSAGTFADAAAFGDLLVLATLGAANENVVTLAKPENIRGKVVIDATNPLDLSKGRPPRLYVGGTDSGGEQLQRLLPEAQVVKAFNTVANAHMFKPAFAGGPPDMFIAGNDEGAKQKVTEILSEFGWATVDIGAIEGARYLEGMALAYTHYGFKNNTWNFAFKLLRN